MGYWSAKLFADDLALDLKHDYLVLLSIGVSNEDAEQYLCEYYSDALLDSVESNVFWLALAHCEFKKGLLSDKVKKKALTIINSGADLERWKNNDKYYSERKKVLEQLKNMLNSEQPKPKVIKKATVHHCPWQVGSLLAYRIISNDRLASDPCYGKYALLRIVRIEKKPISRILPSEYYNESMFVSLYGWLGDYIPDSELADKLEYIPAYPSTAPTSMELPNGALLELDFNKAYMMVCLDWGSGKRRGGQLTYLGRDENFADKLPDTFKKSSGGYVLANFTSYDCVLASILKPYLKND